MSIVKAMTVSLVRPVSLSLVAALLAAACTGTTRPATQSPTGLSQDSIAKLEALYQARIDSARMRFTEADVRFMTAMIAHHAQALVMSRLAPTNGASPSMQILAARIINAQRDEIRTIQGWLRDRGQPVPEVHLEGPTIMVHGADHTMHAAGMLTPDQIQQLERARGPEFDRLFLTYMIQHHRGAVSMVRELFATDGAGQDEEVFKFAADVEADQSSEIARMERMLEELSGAGGTR